ncbi:unnamed protein product [Camellia sinensis]
MENCPQGALELCNVTLYEYRYVDVKFVDNIASYVTVTVDKVGMKLLPTGRKNVFYLTLYGLVLGAGSFLLHHFSMLVNSILVSFGLSEEMHNPVFIFVLLGIVVAGAALGYWMLRKFVISDDGSVDVGVAQFVKWAKCTIAATFIFQLLLILLWQWGHWLLVCESAFLSLPSSGMVQISTIAFGNSIYSANGNPWWSRGRANERHNRAEFLSRSGMVASRGTLWNSPRRSSGWSDSPVNGMISPSTGLGTRNQQDYYSTFHRTPNRKKFSKKGVGEFHPGINPTCCG